ncbi:hypothetical protein M9H77_20775 [Catharanthus roseus]|uniref:Uncharacterized protein n=1 Tax=Catharanthus roseus TaxID=4058 RepID=A0ACC0AKG8_CATRO|nr:hypothetical protein M9H77_20775 [Catharanthus roseus]
MQVFDRKKKRLVEELIDSKIVLAMRAIYQSKFGLGLMDQEANDSNNDDFIKQPKGGWFGYSLVSPHRMSSIWIFYPYRFVSDWGPFGFKDQINLDEAKYPLEHFKTFNEFFIRELKPGARTIAYMDCDDVAVCAADCRLMAFKSAEDSLRFWIKGRKFSIRGLLGDEACSKPFLDGTLVIFRLAPQVFAAEVSPFHSSAKYGYHLVELAQLLQDYHRFHLPVSGTIEKFVHIPGCLYTVNPIAVNSKYCNVFTENKRVAFVAIGATMVGSITFSKKKGEVVRKGDEFGYFSFGGSTVICVFEKDTIKIDDDLLENSERSLETLVSVGMQLGISIKKHSGVGLPNLEKLDLRA